jgi:hypothetical protein
LLSGPGCFEDFVTLIFLRWVLGILMTILFIYSSSLECRIVADRRKMENPHTFAHPKRTLIDFFGYINKKWMEEIVVRKKGIVRFTKIEWF